MQHLLTQIATCKRNIFFIFFTLVFCIPSYDLQSQHTNNLKPIPVETLFKKNTHSSFSISPDGKYFAEVIKNGWQSDIVIVDIDGYKLLNKIAVTNGEVDNVYWLTSERILYEVSGAIMAINIDGTYSTEIADRFTERKTGSSPFFLNRMIINRYLGRVGVDEEEILVLTHNIKLQASLDRVNMFSGNRVSIIPAGDHKMNDWIIDANGKARLGVRFEDDKLRYYIKNPKAEEWIPFHITLDNQIIPVEIKASSYLNQQVTVEGFSYDPDILYLTVLSGSDKRKLIAYNTKSNALEKVLAEDLNCDIQVPDGDALQVLLDHKNRALAGVRYEGITPQFQWFNLNLKNAHSKLNAQYPGSIHDIIDMDKKQERLLIYQWSDINEGNVGVYDTLTDEYAVMFHFNDDLNTYALAPTQIKILTSRDGTRLPCYLNLPPVKNDKHPLIVMPHGGPWARDHWGLDPFVQYFTSRGYAVLRVNFRGSTGFGQEHLLAGIQNIHTTMINDIVDATNKIAEEADINEDNIFIYGHSYGGYATYMALAQHPGLYQGGVAVAAPSDIKVWLKTQRKENRDFSVEFWNTALGSRKNSYLNEISPVNYASQINDPVLIIHGDQDETVPLKQAQLMEKALRKKKKNVDFHILKKEGHSPQKIERLVFMLGRSLRFFEVNLK